MKAFVFGNNQVGQLGIAFGDDASLVPQEISHIEADTISRIAVNQHVTFVVQNNGSLLSCGENENGELARSGKRSWLHRVDALETFQIKEAAVGTAFATLVCDDGKLVSWGRNDLGQLCNGTRENKEKPRVNTAIQESFLQVACGATHGIGLTRTGRVAVWGGNRWGQLGDGQLTSSTKLHFPIQLRHRPVVSVVCGEDHCLAMTVGGNVYSWGENAHGQLGLSDTTNRLRPEQIKALRSMGATKISAGRNHSLVISQGGLLLAFGSNNHGQCGLDSEVKIQPQPMVVERLRELYTVDVSGGSAHTLVLCESKREGATGSAARVFVMGLNSSGQLGLGHTTSVSTPTVLPLSSECVPVGIATGPLAMHTFVLTAPAEAAFSVANPLRRLALPAVTQEKVAETVGAFKAQSRVASSTHQPLPTLVRLREMISAAFASIPVLNASFLLPAAQLGHGSLCVDLKAVRGAYDQILSTEAIDPLAVVTLGRATLHLADQLKECPVDDAENLSVFLIVLENPLMLRAASFHVAIELVVRGILSVPKYYRLILFKWLKSYPSEYFGRVLQVLQGFLCHILLNKSLNLDPTPVILVLETLYQCNCEMKIVPEALFYNPAIPRAVNLMKEWIQFRSPSFDSNVFNYCSYPFLIHEHHKLKLLQFDFTSTQEVQAAVFHRTYPVADHVRERIALLNAAAQVLSSAPPPSTHAPIHQQEGQAQAQAPVFGPAPPPPSEGGGVDAAPAAGAGSAAGANSAPLPRQGPVPSLTTLPSSAIDEIIAQAGPEVHRMVQSTRVVSLPAGTAVTYEVAHGVVSNIEISLEIKVTRSRLLPDLIETLDRILLGDKNTLLLPLKVEFSGEIGVDYGGIKRELFTLAVKDLVTRTTMFAPCSGGRLMWFNHHRDRSVLSSTGASHPEHAQSPQGNARKQARLDGNSFEFFTSTPGGLEAESSRSTVTVAARYPLPFYLGLLVGLAVYNGVHVNLPLPHCVYKTIKGEELTLTDLCAVDAELGAGLQALLSFEEGTGSIEDVFGVTFTASANPLVDNYHRDLAGDATVGSAAQGPAYVELVEDGHDKLVSRVNRTDFVRRFVEHALHGSAAQEIQEFIRGLRAFLQDQSLGMCSATELEHVLCGSKEIGDLSELRKNTKYRGSYTDESPVIQWFWNMLSGLTLADKRRLLHFVTGTERVPLGGLEFLTLTLQSTAQPDTALPTSHTCFNILNIPSTYASAEQLEERFRVALQHHEGFGLI